MVSNKVSAAHILLFGCTKHSKVACRILMFGPTNDSVWPAILLIMGRLARKFCRSENGAGILPIYPIFVCVLMYMNN
jgi:hypothetical protein